jgi:RNA polymerase sigma-70 factor (ECF subfamily)
MKREPARAHEAAEERQERVVRLLSQTQERLTRYVVVLVPDWDLAQEVVQRTHVIAWRKADDFRSDSDDGFYRWVKQIAFYEARKQVASRATGPLPLDPDVAETISREFDVIDDQLEEQRIALAGCIEKLPSHERELLRLRYWGRESIESLSAQLGRSGQALYKALQRIRQRLLDCIERHAGRPKEGQAWS